MRSQLAFVLLVASALARGQAPTVHLEFAEAGSYEAFTAAKVPDEPPKTSVQTLEKGMDVPVSSVPDTYLVIVWDRNRNNVATRPIKNFVNQNWDVASKEFSRLGLIQVRVEHEGKPVSKATVRAKSGDQIVERNLGSEEAGVARFFGFREGKIDVEVKVDAEDGGTKTLKQSFDVRADREDPEIRLIVAVPHKVATLDAPGTEAAEASTPTKTSRDSPPPNPLGQAVVYLLGIGIAVGAIYAAMRLLKKEPAALKAKLEQLGVQIPAADADEPPPPPVPVAPARLEPIVLGDAPAQATGTPRLVSVLGESFEIPEGETVLGRESGLGISLPGEPTVSRRHASLIRTGDTVRVVDHGSTNGTFVNGAKVSGEAFLRPGDEVQFGAIRFRYEG